MLKKACRYDCTILASLRREVPSLRGGRSGEEMESLLIKSLGLVCCEHSAHPQRSGLDSENSFLHTPMVSCGCYFISNQSAYGTMTVREQYGEKRNEVKR